MSRCIPFVLPGCEINAKGRGDALIESIKLQKEWEKAKAERKKEKRREKKEKKEKKKEEKSITASEDKAKRLRSVKSRQEYKSVADVGKKLVEDDSEQLERSSVTEENEPPFCSQNCYSSGSTQTSNKRKWHAVDAKDCSESQARGAKIIRIRFSSKNNQETNGSHHKDESVPSSRAGVVQNEAVSTQQKIEKGVLRTKELMQRTDVRTSIDRECANRLANELPSTSSGGTRNFVDSVPRRGTGNDTEALLFKTLIEEWVPSQLEVDQNDSDDDWLFQTKPKVPERCKPSSEMSCNVRTSLWPHARHIPAADIYALPYTVPF